MVCWCRTASHKSDGHLISTLTRRGCDFRNLPHQLWENLNFERSEISHLFSSTFSSQVLSKGPNRRCWDVRSKGCARPTEVADDRYHMFEFFLSKKHVKTLEKHHWSPLRFTSHASVRGTECVDKTRESQNVWNFNRKIVGKVHSQKIPHILKFLFNCPPFAVPWMLRIKRRKKTAKIISTQHQLQSFKGQPFHRFFFSICLRARSLEPVPPEETPEWPISCAGVKSPSASAISYRRFVWGQKNPESEVKKGTCGWENHEVMVIIGIFFFNTFANCKGLNLKAWRLR